MIRISRKKQLAIGATVSASLALSLFLASGGCELVTDFDRTKIEAGVVEAAAGGGEGGDIDGSTGGGDDGATGEGGEPADGGPDSGDAQGPTEAAAD